MRSVPKDENLSVLTNSIMKNQKTNEPIHTWKKAKLDELTEYQPLELKVSEFMDSEETDLWDEELSCLITDNHKIPIGEFTFWDWED